jgi:amidase
VGNRRHTEGMHVRRTPRPTVPVLRFAIAWGLAVTACQVSEDADEIDDATRELTHEDLTMWNEATVESVHEAFLDERLSATLLTRIYLERIELLDPALKSTLAIDPDALEEAEALDRELRRTGELRGPLHGVPVIIKDNIDVAGIPTTAGCRALSDAYPADDAFTVARLEAAGAIVIAKSNLFELAAFSPRSRSSLGGDTKNAYDLDRAPLGSSGGTATAVSANLALVGLGTDTNSSVLYPAAVAGLVGVRPTQGLLSRDGVVAGLDETTTIGPMTRTVEDAARLLDVLAGSDPADPTTKDADAHLPDGGYLAALDSVQIAEIRLGTSDDFLHSSPVPLLGAEIDPDVERLTGEVLDRLQGEGATVVDVGSLFAVMQPMLPAYLTVLTGEALNTHYELNQYLSGLHEDAPVRSVEEILASGDYLPELEPMLQQIVASPSRPGSENPMTLELRDARLELRDRIVALMDDNAIDVLVYPTTVSAAAPLDTTDMTNYGASAGLSTQSGLPAVTVVLGFDRDGMPLGLTFLGRPWDEARLLAVAHAFEVSTDARRAPIDRFQ